MRLEVNAEVRVLCVIPEVILLQHRVVQATWQAPLLDMLNLHNRNGAELRSARLDCAPHSAFVLGGATASPMGHL